MAVQYKHLIGQPYEPGNQDCYSLIRDFYLTNYGIELPNYARPTGFWKGGHDLYGRLTLKNGFQPLHCHPSEYRIGDMILMSIHSPVCNHAGVLVENGQLLHHFTNRLSTVELYRGVWRNTTCAVMRHKDSKPLEEYKTVSIQDATHGRIS